MSFCVKCGKDIDKGIDGLCIDFFLDVWKLTTLPHHVDLQVCANCGDVRLGDRWVTKDHQEAIEDAAVDALMAIKEAKIVDLEVSSSEQEPSTHVVVIDSTLDIDGNLANDAAATIVRLKNTVCKRCSRQLGNYYEAIVQIRTGSKELSNELKRETLNRVENLVDAQSRNNRQLFITKAEEVQGGLDVYLSSISLGKAVAKDLSDTYCAETKEAAKLVGQTDDGQDMYRLTYLVRLPDFHLGDVVQFENRYYKLSRVSNNGAKIIDLNNFRERSVKRSDMPDIKVHERHGELRDATVVSIGEGEIQVLNPSNYSTIDLRVPEDSEIGDTVKVTDIDDVMYFVP